MLRRLPRRTILLSNRYQSTTRDTVTIIPTVYELTQDKDLSPELNPENSLISYLKSRNLIESITDDNLYTKTKKDDIKHFKLYCGADPTAISLHLGNLLPLMVLLHFQLNGANIVGLIGGATGKVGDPSGRKDERSEIEQNKLQNNIENITCQFQTFFKNGIEYAKSRQFPIENHGNSQILNNFSWWKDIKMLNFLAEFGKYIRISSMINRTSIQSRLQSKEGIGFNEFTYQILQAYDFYHLYKSENVNIQVGGNDQWGNITAGTDLIQKTLRKEAYGITVPLLLTLNGEKFGKSAGNAIFIDSKLTSPYQMYQFFINVPDEMVGKLLKTFTLLPLNVIEGELLPKHFQDSSLRIAQRVLAREVVDLIHGVGIGDEMAFITGFLFPTPDQPYNDNLSAEKLIKNFKNSGILYKYDLKNLEEKDIKLSNLIAEITGKSKSEIKRLIKAGGLYLGLNRDQFNDPDDVVLFDKSIHLIDDKLMLIRIGKHHYYVVEFV
ncbi:unnamed protein product [Candida verbasci]|uniref:Tyrosine--tRNA ligase n=1 Tax=Candida verbasci TaxID=1227364 RepID=A0A9W4U1Z4_9ASCO|nr:unnamed protein product [Candida verbasci]